MTLQQRIINHFADSIQSKQKTLKHIGRPLEVAAEKIVAALVDDKKILACGNGGSAGDAQHFSSEMLNRFERERPALPAIALTTDPLTLTSVANDYHYNQVFAKQISALGQKGDILIVYTSSGHSESVIYAVDQAHQQQMKVIALTGRDGGLLDTRLNDRDIELRVSSHSTARIQEVHLLITHCLCDLIDHLLFGASDD
jgi:D-sedoheptulose 7-phosphate isomerase